MHFIICGMASLNNGKYLHWNHEVLPHWDDVQNIKLKMLLVKDSIHRRE